MDISAFRSQVEIVKGKLAEAAVFLIEAFPVWALNNQNHPLSAELRATQLANARAGHNGAAEHLVLKPLLVKAMEG